MATNLWRNRHDRSETDESLDPVRFALREDIVGVDWAVEADSDETLTWEEYKSRAEKNEYTDREAWVRSVSAIHEHMNEDDLCYMRDSSGQFYLGRVNGPWRYETDPECKRHATVNVRDCDWYRIRAPEETLPTELLESFGRGAVLQRVKNSRLLAFSQRLFEVIDGGDHYDIELPYTMDNWLSDDDLKDLLAIHLQVENDQLLIPSTVDQKPYLPDGMTVSRDSADRTLYQVQHRHETLPPGAYNKDTRRVIYLQRDDGPQHDFPGNVEVIPLEQLKSVFEEHWDVLPRRLRIIGDALQESGSLVTGDSTNTPSVKNRIESSGEPTVFSTRSVAYLVAGLILGLSLMHSYDRWSGSADSSIRNQQRDVLQQKLNDLRSSQQAVTSERDQLKQELVSLKKTHEAQQRTARTDDTRWINVRIRRNDTLSELLERFHGTQDQQSDVVERNNLADRNLIYTGTTLSFPSHTTTEKKTGMDQMATN